jgi:hypothetical protein
MIRDELCVSPPALELAEQWSPDHSNTMVSAHFVIHLIRSLEAV